MHHHHHHHHHAHTESWDTAEVLTPIAIGLAVSGIGCIAFSFFKYKAKIMQTEIAPTIPLSQIKYAVMKDRDQYGKNTTGVYCKLTGKIATDGEPLVAPHSRQKVVLYKVWKGWPFLRKQSKEESSEMVFHITDGTTKVEVDTTGADIQMESVMTRLTFAEKGLVVGRPLHLVGEVVYNPNGDRLTVRNPIYGKAYIVSSESIEDVIASLSTKNILVTGLGALCVLAGVGIGLRSFMFASGHIFAPSH